LQGAQRTDAALPKKSERDIPESTALAALLLARHALPAKARVDALHVAIAATNDIRYLLTWNCRHIANATLREKITATCREMGYTEEARREGRTVLCPRSPEAGAMATPDPTRKAS
jgi:hypothetical protein